MTGETGAHENGQLEAVRAAAATRTAREADERSRNRARDMMAELRGQR